MKGQRQLHSRKEDQWNSPPVVIDLTVQVMGQISLDTCTGPGSIVPAEQSYSLERKQDGRFLPWIGPIYCNPPYSQVEWWVHRMHLAGRLYGQEIFGLVASRTDTHTYQGIISRSADAWLFWNKRLSFIDRHGIVLDPAPFPSLSPYWGPNLDAFIELGRQHGQVVVPGRGIFQGGPPTWHSIPTLSPSVMKAALSE